MFRSELTESWLDASIDMWSMQKDGTLIPDVVLRGKDGVKFGSLNFSDQIKVRIEMQKLFMTSLGLNLATFIDEYSVFSENNRARDCGSVNLSVCNQHPLPCCRVIIGRCDSALIKYLL